MRSIEYSSAFNRDLKKLQRSLSRECLAAIKDATTLLASDSPLPDRMRDHALSGQWKKVNARDCHIAPDLLLIYAKRPGELHLLRLASHSELFR